MSWVRRSYFKHDCEEGMWVGEGEAGVESDSLEGDLPAVQLEQLHWIITKPTALANTTKCRSTHQSHLIDEDGTPARKLELACPHFCPLLSFPQLSWLLFYDLFSFCYLHCLFSFYDMFHCFRVVHPFYEGPPYFPVSVLVFVPVFLPLDLPIASARLVL